MAHSASWRLGCIAYLALAGAGCESLTYYGQAAGGQLRLIGAREPVEGVIAEAIERDPDAVLARHLTTARAIVEFAERELALPAEGSYRKFVALEAEHVVWNVFATEPLSLAGKQWCYPFVGCAPYRGYFSQARAQHYADALALEGFETWVGGVAAYSTLGWFDDPLLSSFIGWPQAEVARLLFHELAHRRVWLPGDVPFNESFASFVADQAVAEWFAGRDASSLYAADLERRQHYVRWRDLLLAARTELAKVFATDAPERARLAARAHVYDALQGCYRRSLVRLGGGAYDGVMGELNNAYLVSLATYTDHVGAFRALFDASDTDWPRFLTAVEALAALDPLARAARLAALADEDVAGGGDQHDTDEIECEALAGHDLGGDRAG